MSLPLVSTNNPPTSVNCRKRHLLEKFRFALGTNEIKPWPLLLCWSFRSCPLNCCCRISLFRHVDPQSRRPWVTELVWFKPPSLWKPSQLLNFVIVQITTSCTQSPSWSIYCSYLWIPGNWKITPNKWKDAYVYSNLTTNWRPQPMFVPIVSLNERVRFTKYGQRLSSTQTYECGVPTTFSSRRPEITPILSTCWKASRTLQTLWARGLTVLLSNCQPSTLTASWEHSAVSSLCTTKPLLRRAATPASASDSTAALSVPITTKLSTYIPSENTDDRARPTLQLPRQCAGECSGTTKVHDSSPLVKPWVEETVWLLQQWVFHPTPKSQVHRPAQASFQSNWGGLSKAVCCDCWLASNVCYIR